MMRRHSFGDERTDARQPGDAAGDAGGDAAPPADAAAGDAPAGGDAAPAAEGGADTPPAADAASLADADAPPAPGGANETAKPKSDVSPHAWHDCHLSGNTKLKCGGEQMSCGCKRVINDHYEDTCCDHDPIKSRPESPVCHETCRPLGEPALAGVHHAVPAVNAGAGAPPGTPEDADKKGDADKGADAGTDADKGADAG